MQSVLLDEAVKQRLEALGTLLGVSLLVVDIIDIGDTDYTKFQG